MPEIGDFKDVGFTESLVKVGNAVVEGLPLIIVETDKASMETRSPQTGMLPSKDYVAGLVYESLCGGAEKVSWL